jgi:hypothetical protein
LKKPFESQIEKINDQTLIAVISAELQRFEDDEYHKILSRLSYLCRPKPEPPISKPSEPEKSKPDKPEYDTNIEDSDTGKGKIKEDQVKPEEKEPVKEMVGIKKIEVNYSKAWIENESEVEDYLSVLKKAILKEINDGKRIQV